MYGKATGMAQGKAGSMHLSSVENGYMGSSAIVPMLLLHFLFPALLSLFFNALLKKVGKIKTGDFTL